jgi:hypothetical protein
MKEASLQNAEIILKKTYQHFNARDIDATLAAMHEDVDWPNGMEGGIEHGHEAVRKYWTRQWQIIDPKVEPVKFEQEDDGRINVTVHQVVHDRQGHLLGDQMIHHIYTIEDGLVRTMEIKNV